MLGVVCNWDLGGLRLASLNLLNLLKYAVSSKVGYAEVLFIVLWNEVLVNKAVVDKHVRTDLFVAYTHIQQTVGSVHNLSQKWLKGLNTLRNIFIHQNFAFSFAEMVEHLNIVGLDGFLALCKYALGEFYDEDLCIEFFADLQVNSVITNDMFTAAVEKLRAEYDTASGDSGSHLLDVSEF